VLFGSTGWRHGVATMAEQSVGGGPSIDPGTLGQRGTTERVSVSPPPARGRSEDHVEPGDGNFLTLGLLLLASALNKRCYFFLR
jgi:hypothetical protein